MMHAERLAAERPYVAAWLSFVEATHRDAYTMATLAEWLRVGEWSQRAFETAQAIVADQGQRATSFANPGRLVPRMPQIGCTY